MTATILDLANLVGDSIVRGKVFWDQRETAYYRAFRRRLFREKKAKGPFGEPSEALIALSSRMIDVSA